jgi:hypothetical protein
VWCFADAIFCFRCSFILSHFLTYKKSSLTSVHNWWF